MPPPSSDKEFNNRIVSSLSMKSKVRSHRCWSSIFFLSSAATVPVSASIVCLHYRPPLSLSLDTIGIHRKARCVMPCGDSNGNVTISCQHLVQISHTSASQSIRVGVGTVMS